MYYHQIYFVFENTKNPIQQESNIIDKYIKKNCKSLQYLFWDFKSACDFVQKNYPMFESFLFQETAFPIIKCDFFRYLLMYHFGGVYTDLDFICIRPFEQFLELIKNKKISYFPNHIDNPSIILSEEWLNSSTFTNTLHNGILISLQEKHPFWLKLVFDIYNSVMVKDGNLLVCKDDVFSVTGPKKLNSFYLENKNIFNDICVLPYFYFCPYISIENDKKIIYSHFRIDNPNTTDLKWIFFNINEHDKLVELCPSSFFVCIYLNIGSMWK